MWTGGLNHGRTWLGLRWLPCNFPRMIGDIPAVYWFLSATMCCILLLKWIIDPRWQYFMIAIRCFFKWCISAGPKPIRPLSYHFSRKPRPVPTRFWAQGPQRAMQGVSWIHRHSCADFLMQLLLESQTCLIFHHGQGSCSRFSSSYWRKCCKSRGDGHLYDPLNASRYTVAPRPDDIFIICTSIFVSLVCYL